MISAQATQRLATAALREAAAAADGVSIRFPGLGARETRALYARCEDASGALAAVAAASRAALERRCFDGQPDFQPHLALVKKPPGKNAAGGAEPRRASRRCSRRPRRASR